MLRHPGPQPVQSSGTCCVVSMARSLCITLGGTGRVLPRAYGLPATPFKWAGAMRLRRAGGPVLRSELDAGAVPEQSPHITSSHSQTTGIQQTAGPPDGHKKFVLQDHTLRVCLCGSTHVGVQWQPRCKQATPGTNNIQRHEMQRQPCNANSNCVAILHPLPCHNALCLQTNCEWRVISLQIEGNEKMCTAGCTEILYFQPAVPLVNAP
jgi:hypothetical protein